MRTVIVIPARLAALRLPNKPLAALGGLPLVVRVADQAKKCPRVDAVIVTSHDEEVLAAAEDHGHTALLTAAHHKNGSERVAEVVQRLGGDRIINLQGDEPFIDPRDLVELLSALAQEGVEIATLKTPITTPESLLDPNVVKVVTDDHSRALYFSRAPIPYQREGGLPQPTLQPSGSGQAQQLGRVGAFAHLGVYAFLRPALERFAAAPVHPLELQEGLEQLRALALGMTILVRPARSEELGINSANDLRRAQQRVDRLGKAAFPDYDPEDPA